MEPPKPDAAPQTASPRLSGLLRPLQAFRVAYLPMLMIYFAFGASGLIDVSRDMWVKEKLTLSPAELAGIGVWLNLPWTVKMVFGELVDSVPVFGSQRKSYVLIGAAVMAAGMLTLAGAAGGWITFARLEHLFIAGAMLLVTGSVVQNVVAEAMSTEVVAHRDQSGAERPEEDVRSDLGMVQVLGRLALSAGVLAVAGLSGWLASLLSREAVFLVGLAVPAVSVIGILLVNCETKERRPLDWRILGGGLALGLVILALALGQVPFSQELIFAISMVAVCTMLALVTRDLDAKERQAILFTSIIIFVFRAVPTVGDGYFWWTLDVLKFDEAFYGTLRQAGAILSIVAMWLLSRQLTEYSVPKVLFWLLLAGTALSLPAIGMAYGLHHWTAQMFGLGARAIALVDTAAASPFAQLSIIPLLSLIAFYTPAGHRATWFALMASLMNLALAAGQLQTKYLNEIFVIARGDYAALGSLLIATAVIAFVVPLATIALLGRRI
jgi:hypothetical protein